jgi:hypothetical protein
VDSFSTLVSYVQEQGDMRWSTENTTALHGAFLQYLSTEFHDELSNCTSDGECSTLSKNLIAVGRFCGIDVSTYDSEIDDFLEQMREAQDDDRDEMWHEPSDAGGYINEESEVHRMFDGLEFNPSS